MKELLQNNQMNDKISGSTFEVDFKKFINKSPNIIYVTDADDTIILVSKGWEKLFGPFPSSESLKKIADFYDPTFKGFPASLDIQLTSVRGQSYRFSPSETPLYTPDGAWVGTVHYLKDVTDYYILAEKLKDKETLFNSVEQSSLDGFWDLNLITQEEYLSPRFKEMFGYKDHEMESSVEAWQKIIYTDDMEKSFIAFDEHVNHGKPYNIPLRYRHKDGSTVHVLCRGTVIRDETGTPVRMIGTHTNITDLKNTQSRLERAKEDLVNFQRLASHDFQEPIRTQLIFIDILTQELSSGSLDTSLKNLSKIKDAAHAIQRLSQTINHYLRLDPNPSKSMLSLETCIEQAQINLQEPIEKEKGVISYGKLPPLCGNADQLSLLFECLIGNALKFRSADAPHITIEGKLIDKRRVLIQFKDNGRGIDEKDLEKIFLPMKKIHAAEDTLGAGMGLAMAKKIVEIHGGEITARGVLDKGTTIFITLDRGDNHARTH